MLVDSVVAEHILQQSEPEEVFVLVAGGIVEYAHIGIYHFVITDHHQGWSVDTFLAVWSLDRAGLGDAREGSLNFSNKAVVVSNASSSHDNHVVSEVVGGSILREDVSVEVHEGVWVASSWLAHHVVSEAVVVALLEGGSFVFSVVLLMLS